MKQKKYLSILYLFFLSTAATTQVMNLSTESKEKTPYRATKTRKRKKRPEVKKKASAPQQPKNNSFLSIDEYNSALLAKNVSLPKGPALHQHSTGPQPVKKLKVSRASAFRSLFPTKAKSELPESTNQPRNEGGQIN